MLSTSVCRRILASRSSTLQRLNGREWLWEVFLVLCCDILGCSGNILPNSLEEWSLPNVWMPRPRYRQVWHAADAYCMGARVVEVGVG